MTQEARKAAAAGGITPLEYMLAVLRDEKADTARRDDMAKAAAPYVHPKLAAVEHSGPDGGPIDLRITGARAALAGKLAGLRSRQTI